MTDALTAWLEAAVRTATPLALAALGEVVAERSGVINLGIEGALIAGAFGALVGAGTGSVATGWVAALCAGTAMGLLFAAFTARLRGDQIIAGTAVSLLGLGLTGTLYRAMYGAEGAALRIPTSGAVEVPGLAALPVVGPAFFAQPAVSYLAYALTGLIWWWMARTHAGLALRACGEAPEAARAAGIRVERVQFLAVAFAGALAGLGGGTLVLAQAGTFAEGMSAGRGFVAIAVVVLGRWHPGGVGLAALLFGAASALQYLLQAFGWGAPYQLFLALPYVLTLAALAGVAGGSRAPAALGRR